MPEHNTIVDQKIGGANTSFRINDDRKIVELFSIRVPQAKRKQGLASKALKQLVAMADRLGYQMELIASPLDRKTSTELLVHIYQKHGFELTGRSANPMGDPIMVREVVAPRTKWDGGSSLGL